MERLFGYTREELIGMQFEMLVPEELLKADPATADIPVVVLSADATASQVERLRAAGAADYLTKPLDVERLMAVLAGDVTAPTS
jgi:CheY-like chemotaxis protein